VPENYNHPDPFGVYMCKTGFFCTDYRNGCAHDILFRNIQILTDGQVTPPPTPKFLGISPENNVQDIVIENLTIDGVKAETPEEAHIITNDFADRIIIR